MALLNTKRKLLIIGVIVFVTVGLEVYLRMYYGFCNTVLFQVDPEFEYIAQPNQQRYRFRNNIVYNSKSMRSEEIDSTAEIILGFGDSILNGGVLTDQDSLATTIISNSLSNLYQKKIQFLNISSGSWGPDNAHAYLEKYGNFNSKSIFLFVSSHDAYDNMEFEENVDKYAQLPSKQYSIAIYELFDRYLLPRISQKLNPSTSQNNGSGIDKRNRTNSFNPGFQSFLDYANAHNMSFTIYLHADYSELIACEYNEQGQKIIAFAKAHSIPLVLDLKYDPEIPDLRDGIHLTNQGQRKMAKTIINYITEQRTTNGE
ncbi:hypothetical protein [Kordia jejudonensis]|uniref:hypothetical protein n=1 Tax=Kordia jejudonensis TaxID=1348245 RepID=UPI0006290C2C|nr:hypothetical protein [Kordia jejudonensis]